jgi:5'-methylthioadenosine phosphorylase
MKLGIIGGSGLYHLPELEIRERRQVTTPCGPPSDALVMGSLAGSELIFLPRHGSGHSHNPSELPYRANIYALKEAGVTHLLSVNAVGSLQPHLPPLTLVIPDQIIDRTVSRDRTYFEQGIVAHVGIADPFCPELGEAIAIAATRSGHPAVSGGTYICIEGPQFSTKAESRLYRSWDASVIGMTVMPEARLAREAELCYVSLSMVTDFDVWHEEEEPVTVEMVQERLRANTADAQAIITTLAKTGLPQRSCGCGSALASAIITDPARITDAQRQRLDAIIGHSRFGDHRC